MWLPRAEGEISSVEAGDSVPSHPGRVVTVPVVEDDEAVRELSARLLHDLLKMEPVGC